MEQELKRGSEVRVLNRREMLLLAGGTTTLALFEYANGQSALSEPKTIVGCVVSPEQTEGPYFVDEKLNRSDIRTDPADKSVRPGVLLHLTLNVFQVSNKNCKPLPGATVDIWHCDALGAYSDVLDREGDTRGKKFLRGFQITDANGKVEFRTIYPGWYGGRTAHIHFMVRTNQKSGVGHEFTSQLYFDDATTDQVYAQKPYSERGKRDTTNNRDGIYRRGGNQLMLQQSKDSKGGYLGTYNIGFQIT